MRKTGIEMRWLDQQDTTPRHILGPEMYRDLMYRHRTEAQVEAHTRTFLTPPTDRHGRTITQTVVTVRWTTDPSGNDTVVQVFEDTRGTRVPDPNLT